MTLGTVILGLLLLQIKHVFADYLLQPPYLFLNKGNYGHPGGLLHSGLHAVLTVPALLAIGVPAGLALTIAVIEFVFHYHVDWTKEFVNRRYRLGPTTGAFWYVHGVDQAIHQFSYVAIIWWVAT